eukprot:CAMPEP_0116143726 /NCGR_PEP_ID=MMETSP0329-20121206/15606_1 /TAXON_ID=697910 /ORGANISM="Pseudo-nitzschia arenysensis, Strain B593" /LENGTH=732 /DNA_ID=CAMNT_0003639069 /DNA_START=111 /DNA_END=2306 /DNA_ORIENTATION=-
MPQSNSTFDGTFDDEDESGSEVTSSGEEESYDEEESVEESSEEEVPESVSGLPFDKKVKMFNSGGKLKSSSDEFEDEGSESESESESGSEYSDDESGSESEYSDNDDQEDFLNEQERLRGMGNIPPNNSRKWLLISIAICCVLSITIGVGLGLGLTRNKDKDDEPADKGASSPDTVPTFAPGMEPTNAPIRMPIKLPNPPDFDAVFSFTEDVKFEVESDQATTIYRTGDLSEVANGEATTLLVQKGSADDADLPAAFALVELAVPLEQVDYLLADDALNATFCLDHVPDESIPDRSVTYTTCPILGGAPSEGVETLTGLNANYLIPDDCVGGVSVNFAVSPTDTKVCMDVTGLLFAVFNVRRASFNVRRARRGLRGRRALEDSTNVKKEVVLMMIDYVDDSDLTGDKFYNEENKQPTLTIEGSKVQECTTIVDVICSDERFSTLCTLAQAANLETVLGDNRSIFTVFAPTNDAIEKLLATGVDTSDPVFMEYLLSTHVVVSFQITSSDIDCTKPELPPLLMANDELTNVICDSGSIFVVGGGNTEDARPKVVDADIETCNGIIHAIDTVILPQAKTSSQQKEDVDEVVETGDCEPLIDVLCSTPSIAGLCSFVTLFEDDALIGPVIDTLETAEGTVFLPNNEAAIGLTGLSSDTQLIADLLTNHFVPGEKLKADDLACDGELIMAGGKATKTECVGDDKFQVGAFNEAPNPKIIETNIETCTATIHVVDQVI